MSNLKPCPFCGGKATQPRMNKGQATILCTECDAALSAPSCERVVEIWNTRVGAPKCGICGAALKNGIVTIEDAECGSCCVSHYEDIPQGTEFTVHPDR